MVLPGHLDRNRSAPGTLLVQMPERASSRRGVTAAESTNMPTLKRLLIAAGGLGLLGLAVIVVLGNLPQPGRREITVDVPQERLAAAIGRGARKGLGSLQRDAPQQLAETLETVKLGP
jgi:hypothetical protein